MQGGDQETPKRIDKQIIMRLLQFDALKLFAIYMVILGHCIQHLLSTDYVDETGYVMIYSFHMPLFMMLSGYFASSGLKRNFLSGIVTKARQLLLPCISASVIMALLYYVAKGCNFSYRLNFELLYAFWFLKTAFFCFLLARTAYSFGKFKIIAFLTTLFLTQIPQINHIPYFTTNIDIMYPCFVVGILLKTYWDRIQANSKSIAIVTGIIFAVMLLFWGKEFWQPTYAMLYKLKAGEYTEGFYLTYIRLYKLAIGISGSIFFITLFHLCISATHNAIVKKACTYGEYTMGIYILQTFVLETILAQYINFDNVNSWVFNLLIAPLLSILILTLCTYLSKILDRYKYTAFLFLGKKIE